MRIQQIPDRIALAHAHLSTSTTHAHDTVTGNYITGITPICMYFTPCVVWWLPMTLLWWCAVISAFSVVPRNPARRRSDG